jgi:hypothetical protein
VGTFHSQCGNIFSHTGNNLRPYFFFVEMWKVLVAFVELLFLEDFVVALVPFAAGL